MRKITVNLSTSYDIFIGPGLLDKSSELIAEIAPSKKCAVVTDDVVDKLYSRRLIDSLRAAGFSVAKFVFPHGEQSKSLDVLTNLYNFLSKNDITRSDFLIALGGGVVGDLTGFCAASYLRGIPFVQVPTTLLAQVDSSIGGKTGVNIAAGKNLVGAFKQPLLVISDTKTLDTLDDELFADGMGEVVKYGMIRSESLFRLLENGDVKGKIADIIEQCVAIKRDVVQNDEHDAGERMILNFGHTLGHAIEKYKNFSGISHGKAVAVGMALISAAAEKTNLANGVYERLCECLKKNNLPTDCDVPPEKLFELSINDKKRDSGNIRIIICPKIGTSEIHAMSLDDYKKITEKI